MEIVLWVASLGAVSEKKNFHDHGSNKILKIQVEFNKNFANPSMWFRLFLVRSANKMG